LPDRHLTFAVQVAVIEVARSLLNWTDANSQEFNKATAHPVVIFMPEGGRLHCACFDLGTFAVVSAGADGWHDARLQDSDGRNDAARKPSYAPQDLCVSLRQAVQQPDGR
jgi:hypothetical protein